MFKVELFDNIGSRKSRDSSRSTFVSSRLPEFQAALSFLSAIAVAQN